MHIGFRTSGGRGEYELVSGASGQSASDLEGWTLHMIWHDGRMRDTMLWMDPGESGKPRLRSLAKKPYQVGRLLSAMLILPPPHRELPEGATGDPILQAGKYLLMKVGFGPDTSFASPPESVQFTPNYIEIRNRDLVAHIGVEARWRRVEAIYARLHMLDTEVSEQLIKHRDILATGDPIDQSLNRVVIDLIDTLADTDATYVHGWDPLPALESQVGLSDSGGPDLPPPDEIGEEDIPVRIRSAQIYRLSRNRGPAGRRFSREVRRAYHHQCAFCGIGIGDLPGISSGIEAAHILAWSEYNLDVLSNGMGLCKLHHWAFDSSLLVPEFQAGVGYVVRHTSLCHQILTVDDRAMLGPDNFVIPVERLPADSADWPNPKYLIRLYEDLSIIFD